MRLRRVGGAAPSAALDSYLSETDAYIAND